MRADVSQSRDHLLLKWNALIIEIDQLKFVETALREVIATKEIKQLVGHGRFAVQILNLETVEMAHTQGSLDFIFDFVDYPGHRPCNCLNVVNL